MLCRFMLFVYRYSNLNISHSAIEMFLDDSSMMNYFERALAYSISLTKNKYADQNNTSSVNIFPNEIAKYNTTH
jgi:hypothetical protein